MESKEKAVALAGAHGREDSNNTDYCPRAVRRAQRLLVLRVLRERGHASTLELRELGVMHPAGRIMELRKSKHHILTERDPVQSCGRYHLIRNRKGLTVPDAARREVSE